MYDAVIVGSGPNGLSAAVALAQAGKKVVVFEGRDTIGGGTRTEELTEPGVAHDVCSAVHPLGIGSPFLSTLPLHEHGLEWVHPPIAFAHALEGTDSVFVRRSVEETAEGLGPDGPAWSKVFGRFAADWDRTARLTTGPALRAARTPLAGLRMARYGLVSGERLANRFETDRARAAVAGLTAHAAAPLDTGASAGVAVTLGAAAHAVGWPFARGGSAAIANALASYLRSLGGEIHTGRWVRRLSDLPDTRAVLFDTSPEAVAAVAGELMSSGRRRRYRSIPRGPGSFKVDITTNGPIPWADERLQAAGTVHLGGTFEEIADAEEDVNRGNHPERPFVLLAQPVAADDTRAPAGIGVVWAYCHVPIGSTVDMSDHIVRQIERFAPGFTGRIRHLSSRGPAEFEADNPNDVGGDITGGALSLTGVLRRPTLFRPYRAGTGVYLCSSSTPPGAGVHGMCGYWAAQAVLKDR